MISSEIQDINTLDTTYTKCQVAMQQEPLELEIQNQGAKHHFKSISSSEEQEAFYYDDHQQSKVIKRSKISQKDKKYNKPQPQQKDTTPTSATAMTRSFRKLHFYSNVKLTSPSNVGDMNNNNKTNTNTKQEFSSPIQITDFSERKDSSQSSCSGGNENLNFQNQSIYSQKNVLKRKNNVLLNNKTIENQKLSSHQITKQHDENSPIMMVQINSTNIMIKNQASSSASEMEKEQQNKIGITLMDQEQRDEIMCDEMYDNQNINENDNDNETKFKEEFSEMYSPSSGINCRHQFRSNYKQQQSADRQQQHNQQYEDGSLMMIDMLGNRICQFSMGQQQDYYDDQEALQPIIEDKQNDRSRAYSNDSSCSAGSASGFGCQNFYDESLINHQNHLSQPRYQQQQQFSQRKKQTTSMNNPNPNLITPLKMRPNEARSPLQDITPSMTHKKSSAHVLKTKTKTKASHQKYCTTTGNKNGSGDLEKMGLLTPRTMAESRMNRTNNSKIDKSRLRIERF